MHGCYILTIVALLVCFFQRDLTRVLCVLVALHCPVYANM